MAPLFVTPSGKLRERWIAAFPEALVFADVTAIGPDLVAGRVIWLDTSALALQGKLNWIGAAVALGSPVVVMAATPGESEAFLLLNAGAKGYCHVTAAPEQLREIAVVVAHGGCGCPPS